MSALCRWLFLLLIISDVSIVIYIHSIICIISDNVSQLVGREPKYEPPVLIG